MAISLSSEPSAIDEINMTPLIDVMLVLLVMFIITIPLQTQAVKLDLPEQCTDCPVVGVLKNKLIVTDEGAILWNAHPVARRELRSLLAASMRMPREPELHFQPEPNARWDLVDEVLAMTKRAGVKRMGFVGNESYRTF